MKAPKDKASNTTKRLRIVATKKTGFYWAGKPCHCEVYIVRVTEQHRDRKYWATPFVGTERQVIQVNVAGHPPFYIDNADGTGWIKVRHGYGAPQVFHRGIIEPELISVVPDDQIQLFDIVKYNEVENQIAQWIKEVDPELYEKTKQLREQARKRVAETAKIQQNND